MVRRRQACRLHHWLTLGPGASHHSEWTHTTAKSKHIKTGKLSFKKIKIKKKAHYTVEFTAAIIDDKDKIFNQNTHIYGSTLSNGLILSIKINNAELEYLLKINRHTKKKGLSIQYTTDIST